MFLVQGLCEITVYKPYLFHYTSFDIYGDIFHCLHYYGGRTCIKIFNFAQYSYWDKWQLGKKGTGKSYLAACIANALMKSRIPVLFTSVIRMTSADPDTVREVIGQTRRARLLVLDDLGAERGTDFKLEQVFNIIETRSNSRKPLIVTTNYSENDMRGENDVRYKRIWERVRAMCYPVRMESVSWRKDITAEALERFRKLTT